jgi:hypothetical protein
MACRHTSRAAVKPVGWWLIGVAGLSVAAATFSACSATARLGESSAYLVIDVLEGAPAKDDERFLTTVHSDVRRAGVVSSDLGRAVFRLALKDPGTVALPLLPSPADAITVNRYRVRFVRSDGRNAPGVDVPHPFEGAVTLTVGADGGVGTFVLVRAQSKLEPPLAALAGAGGAVAIATVAEITFHGADQAGRAVIVSGRISVDFADWADPD